MNKIVSILGNGEKQWSCEFSPYNLSSKTKQNKKMKKTDKQSNLLSLTVSCEKRSCLSEVKTTQNKAKQHQQQKKDWEIDEDNSRSNNSNNNDKHQNKRK